MHNGHSREKIRKTTDVYSVYDEKNKRQEYEKNMLRQNNEMKNADHLDNGIFASNALW